MLSSCSQCAPAVTQLDQVGHLYLVAVFNSCVPAVTQLDKVGHLYLVAVVNVHQL